MEMLPVWSILLIPLFTAFVITLFLQKYDRAAGGLAVTSISVVFLLTLTLPFMTIPDTHPAASSQLAPEADASGNRTGNLFIYRTYQDVEPVDHHGEKHSVRGWTIRAQRSVFDWAQLVPRKDKGESLPLGAPPSLEEDGFSIQFGVMIDNLAFFMLFVVAFVGLLVHVFSLGYLAHEGAWGRYFAGLQLFCFSMLGIVLSPNYFQTFIFWELVGVSSYILIGHYYDQDDPRYPGDPVLPAPPPEAAKKAFMTNRVADFGFMIGILMLFFHTGTVDFLELQGVASSWGPWSGHLGTVVGVLLFVGAMGKSAQFPFHIWLPDAMSGPTPVSALMHAATMVAAGVYLVIRSYPIYNHHALQVMAWVGVITACLSALMAVVQTDIKKVLAYSTLSQLGYMVMILGIGGFAEAAVHHGAPSAEVFLSQCYTAGMFHLTTHAFFKALLFLAAGAVIVGMHHHQDMREMGGLFHRMPWTGACFLIGTLALAGVPPFAGFWSKDLILHLAHQANSGIYLLASGAAFLTAFYMGRTFLLTFLGEGRSKHAEHAHEVGGSMVLPLVVLAVFSIVSGWWGQHGIPGFEGVHGELRSFSVLVYNGVPWMPHLDVGIAAVSTLVGGIAFGVSFLIYGLGIISQDWFRSYPPLVWAYELVRNKFYCDHIALFLVKKVQDTFAQVLNILEQHLLIGVGVYGVASLFRKAGAVLRLYQTGNVRTYASLLLLGTLLLLYLVTFSSSMMGFGG